MTVSNYLATQGVITIEMSTLICALTTIIFGTASVATTRTLGSRRK